MQVVLGKSCITIVFCRNLIVLGHILRIFLLIKCCSYLLSFGLFLVKVTRSNNFHVLQRFVSGRLCSILVMLGASSFASVWSNLRVFSFRMFVHFGLLPALKFANIISLRIQFQDQAVCMPGRRIIFYFLSFSSSFKLLVSSDQTNFLIDKSVLCYSFFDQTGYIFSPFYFDLPTLA